MAKSIPPFHTHESRDALPPEKRRVSVVDWAVPRLEITKNAMMRDQKSELIARHGQYMFQSMNSTNVTPPAFNQRTESDARNDVNTAFAAHGGRQPAYEVDPAVVEAQNILHGAAQSPPLEERLRNANDQNKWSLAA